MRRAEGGGGVRVGGAQVSLTAFDTSQRVCGTVTAAQKAPDVCAVIHRLSADVTSGIASKFSSLYFSTSLLPDKQQTAA